MCNTCNNSLASILNNLFGSPCGCQNNGCQNGWNNFSNGFISGVNAANAAGGNGNNGCGCGCQTPTPYGFDNYYAQQYALGPYSQNNGCGCGCNGNNF